MNVTRSSSGSEGEEIAAWSTRKVVYATLIVAVIALSFFLFFQYIHVVFLLFTAMVVGTAIRPAVNRLNLWGVSRSLGVILVYLLILLLFVAVIAAAAPLLVEQASAISQVLPDYYSQVRSTLFLSENLILQRVALNLPAEISLTPGRSGSQPAPADQPPDPADPAAQPAPAGPYLRPAGLAALGVASVFVLGFFWTLERERTLRSLLLWIPMNGRENARELILEIEDKVGGFVIGQGILCLAVGSLAFLAYALIGVPYALVLGILAGITEAIPVFGPILGTIPALLVALAVSPEKAVWVLAAGVVIQVAENYVLVPRVMKRSVGVNPLVLLLSFVAFSLLFGVVGAIISVPLAAILQLLTMRFLVAPSLTPVQQAELGRDQLSLFRLEAQTLAVDLRKQLVDDQGGDVLVEKTVDTLESITTELDTLLAQYTKKEAAQ